MVISNTKCEKLLGIHTDKELTFEPNLKSLCKKPNQKFDQIKILLNAFITSQFSYAPVVWIFYNRTLNNHINRIHERSLRIAYQDHNSTVPTKFMTVICRDY